METGALVAWVALSLVTASIPTGRWLRRPPRCRSAPRPDPWMVTEAAAQAEAELSRLSPAERKAVGRAVDRGNAVDDPALALAAYRVARSASATERAALAGFPRGSLAPTLVFLALFAPGLIRGQDRVFGESGVVDAALVLLAAGLFVAEALRSPRALRRSELAEQLNSDLIVVADPETPVGRGRRTHRRSETPHRTEPGIRAVHDG